MSATTYGIDASEIVPQADFAARQSENGGWRASASYIIRREDLNDQIILDSFPKGTTAYTLDTTLGIFGRRLYLDNAQVTSRNGGLTTIRANFAGFTSLAADPDNPQETTPTYRLRGGLREAPIEEHPTVVALSDDDRWCIGAIVRGTHTWVPEDGGYLGVFYADAASGEQKAATSTTQPTAGAAENFCILASQGTTTYPSPSYVWEKTWEAENPIANSELNNLGKIDTPDGDPPEADGTRDWLLEDADMQLRGQLYHNFKSWRLSERGGWNALIHDY